MSLFSKVSASAVAALVAITPAAAQPPAEPDIDVQPEQTTDMGVGSRITVIGAINDPSAPAAPVAAEEETVPELPIVYEDDGQG